MAKQSFTVGQVLTASEMTNLQQTAMGGGSTTAKTASYTLVAADAGTVVQMNSASATTITVNTALFAAGDTVQIQNVGAGVCTVTAGTATVSTAGSLALSQYEGGQLYFNTTSAALFFDLVQSAAAGGKVLQVVTAQNQGSASTSSTTYQDSTITLAITPTLNTSKVLVMFSTTASNDAFAANNVGIKMRLMRNSTDIQVLSVELFYTNQAAGFYGQVSNQWLDSPATTSATTYKVQFANGAANANTIRVGGSSGITSIILMEIGA